MVELIWDERFKKIYKKWIHQHPDKSLQTIEVIILQNQDVLVHRDSPELIKCPNPHPHLL